MPTTLRSFSKINLGLAIGPPRPDGFHALTTLYQTLALHDLVTVSARPAPATEIRLTSNHSRVPLDQRNTAWRAVSLAIEHLRLPAVVDLHIEKRLPIQGGLGAGSANAAAALLALEAELAHPDFALDLRPHAASALSGPDRLRLAAEVGSDVPLFLLGGAVLGQGRGELVTPLPDLAPKPIPCVVAIPAVGVSTPAAFRDWDNRAAKNHLTADAEARRLDELSFVIASSFAAVKGEGRVEPSHSGILHDRSPERKQGGLSQEGTDRENLRETPLLSLVRTGILNDFEEVVFSQHPPLRTLKRLIVGEDSGAPALYAALSGSGSALFGLFRSAADAQQAQQRVQDAGTEALLTETLPRGPYWATMVARDI